MTDTVNLDSSKLLVQHLADAEFANTGRRAFFEYRDTGLGDQTEGAYRGGLEHLDSWRHGPQRAGVLARL